LALAPKLRLRLSARAERSLSEESGTKSPPEAGLGVKPGRKAPGDRIGGRGPESGPPRAGLVDGDVPAHERLVVEPARGFRGLGRVAEFDEGESPLLPGLTIHGNDHGGKGSGRFEESSQVRFGGIIGKVPYKQTYRHCSPF
jgi:hypothetical protein